MLLDTIFGVLFTNEMNRADKYTFYKNVPYISRQGFPIPYRIINFSPRESYLKLNKDQYCSAPFFLYFHEKLNINSTFDF